MRRISTLLAALGVAALLATAAQTANTGRFTLRGTVTYVVDGDTVDVRLTSGRTERIRLIGIDTPERGRCDAAKATTYARSLAQGRATVARGDATQATRDRYGRLLAYVWLPDGRMLNRVMIDKGYAQPLTIPPNVAFADVFRAGARAARQAGLGLWRACGAAG
jgi:micrococcal nuclease